MGDMSLLHFKLPVPESFVCHFLGNASVSSGFIDNSYNALTCTYALCKTILLKYRKMYTKNQNIIIMY